MSWRARVPPPVVTLLDDYIQELRAALGDDLVAVWVYGAVAAPGSEAVIADVDGHAVVGTGFDAETRARVEKVHERMRARHGWLGDEIDVWYVTSDDVRGVARPRSQRRGVVDEAWALHRAHLLSDRRIVLHGPPPDGIVVAPRWEELEADLRAEIRDCARWAGSGGAAYAVLQAARVLLSLEKRDVIVSKQEAGEWARRAMPERWRALVDAAIERYEAGHEGALPQVLADGAPAFISWTAEQLP